jgi:hypothetical protein
VSRETLFQTQRAFMNCLGPDTEPVHQKTGLGDFDFMRVTVKWENTGATPAPVAINYIHAEVFPLDHPNLWIFAPPAPGTDFRKMYAGPHTPLSVQTTNVPMDLMMHKQPGGSLTVWGWMVYRDVIPGSITHLTEFCYHETELNQKPDAPRLDSEGNPLVHLGLQWTLCAPHNCADEYCEDYNQIVANLHD